MLIARLLTICVTGAFLAPVLSAQGTDNRGCYLLTDNSAIYKQYHNDNLRSGKLNVKGPVGQPMFVTYDPKKDLVLWSDKIYKHIAVAKLDGTGYTVLTSYEGILKNFAFDPSSRLLFLIQTYPYLLTAFNVDSKKKARILSQVDFAGSITLDVYNRFVYFGTRSPTNPNLALIARMKYDGTEKEELEVSFRGNRLLFGFDVAMTYSQLDGSLYLANVSSPNCTLYQFNLLSRSIVRKELMAISQRYEFDTTPVLTSSTLNLFLHVKGRDTLFGIKKENLTDITYILNGMSNFLRRQMDGLNGAHYIPGPYFPDIANSCSRTPCPVDYTQRVCIPTSGDQYSCLCDTDMCFGNDYYDSSGRKKGSYVAKKREDFLLVSVLFSSNIKLYYPASNSWQELDLPRMKNPLNAVYDAALETIYWLDGNILSSVKLNGSDYTVLKNFTGSLAIDPSSKLLYYTDIKRKMIVAHHTESHKESFIARTSKWPGHLSLDASNGWLYWIENENIFGENSNWIERSRLDGSRREMFYMNSTLIFRGIYTYKNDIFICGKPNVPHSYLDKTFTLLQISTVTKELKFSSTFRNMSCSDIQGNKTSIFVTGDKWGVQVASMSDLSKFTRLPGQLSRKIYVAPGLFYHSANRTMLDNPCSNVSCEPRHEMCLPSEKGGTCHCLVEAEDCMEEDLLKTHTITGPADTLGIETTPSVAALIPNGIYFEAWNVSVLSYNDTDLHIEDKAKAYIYRKYRYGVFDFDLDVRNKRIFYNLQWRKRNYIMSAIPGNSRDSPLKQTVIARRVMGCGDLAYDWIHENLYFAQDIRNSSMRTSNFSINRINVRTGSFERIVSNNVSKPSSLVVEPLESYIFWVNWNNSDTTGIFRCNLDGSHLQIISNISYVGDLVYDYTSHLLYVAGRRSIYSMTASGSLKRTILYLPSAIFFKFDIYQDVLLLGESTDDMKEKVQAYNRTSGLTLGTFAKHIYITGLRINHIDKQPEAPGASNNRSTEGIDVTMVTSQPARNNTDSNIFHEETSKISSTQQTEAPLVTTNWSSDGVTAASTLLLNTNAAAFTSGLKTSAFNHDLKTAAFTHDPKTAAFTHGLSDASAGQEENTKQYRTTESTLGLRNSTGANTTPTVDPAAPTRRNNSEAESEISTTTGSGEKPRKPVVVAVCVTIAVIIVIVIAVAAAVWYKRYKHKHRSGTMSYLLFVRGNSSTL